MEEVTPEVLPTPRLLLLTRQLRRVTHQVQMEQATPEVTVPTPRQRRLLRPRLRLLQLPRARTP